MINPKKNSALINIKSQAYHDLTATQNESARVLDEVAVNMSMAEAVARRQSLLILGAMEYAELFASDEVKA